MKNILSAIFLISMLSGCVIIPRNSYYVQSDTVSSSRYQHQQVYYWDASYGLYFYVSNGNRRHYMPRGWVYRTYPYTPRY